HSQNTSNFYDPKTVQEIKITFAQQNWRYLLDSLRYNGNELLNCAVEVNGTKLKDAGLRYLHLVDLDGARSSRIVNYKTLYNISTHTNLQVDFGGGLKTDDDLSIALENGAFQVT
ncbi:MAG TPA: HisA/HisF-related TIM barrel protein, partial [Saprospiraceae bacterium]|nr:HisA/HisF-related TIM barrel protein [Saprospiraceae bacterium]